MIGDVFTIDKQIYLETNKEGTLEKLPKIPWWLQAYFQIKNCFKISVPINEIRRLSNKYKIKQTRKTCQLKRSYK